MSRSTARLLADLTLTFALLGAMASFAPCAVAQTYQVIHTFTGEGDGFQPYSGLTIDSGGHLYGTTTQYYGGTVFQMKEVNGSWVLDTILQMDSNNGRIPYGRPVFGPGGSMFGTTLEGGTSTFCEEGCGAVYNIRPPQTVCKSVSCSWSGTAIWSFDDQNDGGSPEFVDPIFDAAGNLYGTASIGGFYGVGVVYKMTNSNGAWTQTVIHNFNASDGSYPFSGVVMDSEGNLYGTTWEGGVYLKGAIYRLSPSGSGWQETILYSFKGVYDGELPVAALIFDRAGNLYGSASAGGINGGGTVFELSPSGSGWNFSVLYSLTGQTTQQTAPGVYGPLAMDAAGNLYGTAYAEGANARGAIFKLSPSNGGWTYTSLHDFTGGSDGGFPTAGPNFDSSGNLYGTTVFGGNTSAQLCQNQGCGVVWEITP